MATSVHDHTIVGYEVDARERRLAFHTELKSNGAAVERCTVIFSGVEAYYLEHDSFGTILFGIDEVPATTLFDNNLARFEAGHKAAGWPRFWKRNADDARHYLKVQKRGFEISSSIGMSGWVLAGTYKIVGKDVA